MCVLTFSVLASALGAIGGGIGAAATAAGSAVTGIGASLGLTGAWATAAGVGVLGAEAVSMGATLAGGIASTVGGIQQQQAIAAQAEFQAKVEDENAKIAAQSAEANKLQANQKRLALLNQMRQMQGRVRTDFAGRGVVLGSGTPNDFEADLADSYDMDRRNLEYDVASKSWQYKVNEAGHRQQADLYRAQAKGARALIPGVAAGGLLSTAGNLAQGALSSFSLGTELGLFGKGGSEAAASAATGTLNNSWAFGTQNHGLTKQQPLFGAGVTRNDWWRDPLVKKFGGV